MKSEDFIQLRLLLGTYVTAPLMETRDSYPVQS